MGIRTTIVLDEDVLERVRERAREEGDRVWEGKIERIQTEGLRVEWTSAFQV